MIDQKQRQAFRTARQTAVQFLKYVCLAVGFAVSLSAGAASKPNFIVILTDDLGYGDFGCYGATDMATPQIDRMAKEGLKLTSFYVSPVCSPTRASLMTGCYAKRVGVGGVMFERNPVGLHLDEKTIPELLKEQGYATAFIGKWHLGYQNDQHPPNHGFDYWVGTLASNSTSFTPANKTFAKDCVFRDGLTRESVKKSDTVPCSLMCNDEVIEAPADQTQFTKRYTEETIKFLTENKDRSFFIYLAHNMPHIPIHASEAFVGKSERGLYGDVIEELDWGVGEVLKALEEPGAGGKHLRDPDLGQRTQESRWRQFVDTPGRKGFQLRRRCAGALSHAMAREDPREPGERRAGGDHGFPADSR